MTLFFSFLMPWQIRINCLSVWVLNGQGIFWKDGFVMSNIAVALTTTGFLKESDGGELFETVLWRSNIPICVAEIGIGLFGPDIEQMEHIMAQSCLASIGSVFIDTEKRFVFIGENPDIEDTGMIIYTPEEDTDCNRSFFARWEESHHLLLQYCFYGMDKKPLFSIVGYWIRDHWKILEVKHSENFHIINPA